MNVELAMTDCDLDRNAYPWITNLTVMDSIVLLGQANLLDLVDARGGFLWLGGATINVSAI